MEETDIQISLTMSRSRSLYVVARQSVCRLSVTLVHPSHAVVIKLRQFFYGIWYLGHLLTCTENFMEIIPGEPPPSEELNPRGVANIAIFDLSID